MNGFNLSEGNMQTLLEIAGKKLGQSPEALRQQLESGNIDGLLKQADPQMRARMNGVLQDPKGLEALLADQGVRTLLKGFLGRNG